MYPLRLFGDPVLKQRAREVEEIDGDLVTVVNGMYETMDLEDGIGLAAPQVGVRKRVFTFDLHEGEGPGVVINPEILAGAMTSALTWGIVVGLVVGKFIGVFGSAAVLRLLRVGEFGPGLTLDRIAGGAALCGIGFTISLFIVDLAIDDPAAQNQARVGVLAASVIAFVIATVIFRVSDAIRPDLDSGQTLARPVDAKRDHVFAGAQ